MSTPIDVLTKRTMIDKANSRMVIVAGIAAFAVVFSLIASKGLVGHIAYQNKIVSAKKEALTTLQANREARDKLVAAYGAFTSTSENSIGGDPGGEGDRDGDNAKITLDALPSKYDFPALATSLEKLASAQNLTIQGITGTDDEVAQSSNQGSGSPQPVAMPFQLTVNGGYGSIRNLIATLEKSIRPIQVQSIQISGDEDNLSATISAQTFYQPEKVFKIEKKVIQ